MQSVLNPYQNSTFTNTLTFGKSDLNTRKNFLDEIKGAGNSYNYTYRMHDPRIGRFFAVDPLTADYPHNSPYAFSENVVINAVELEGLELAYVYNVTNEFSKKKKVKKSHDYDNRLDFNQRVYRYFNAHGEVYKEMVQKLDKNGNVISTQIENYGCDGDVNTKNTLLSEKTRGEKPDPWYSGTIFAPGALEGGDDGANYGGKYAGEHGWDNGGKQLFFGTIGLVGAPFAFGGAAATSGIVSAWGYFTASVSAVNAIDDLGGVLVSTNDPKYNSFIESFSDDPSYKNMVRNAKAIGTAVTFINGSVQIWDIRNGADAEKIATLIGVITDGAQLGDVKKELDGKENK